MALLDVAVSKPSDQGTGAAAGLSRYGANTTLPRPESYREDVALAEAATSSGRPAAALWHALAADTPAGSFRRMKVMCL